MNKLLLGLVAAATLTLSSFTTTVSKEALKSKDCTYRMYSNGQFVGYWTISDVPDNEDCNSEKLKNMAIITYNALH